MKSPSVVRSVSTAWPSPSGLRTTVISRSPVDCARIAIGVLRGDIGGKVEIAFRKAEIPQRQRRSRRPGEIPEPAADRTAKNLRHGGEQIGHGDGVEGRGVRQHDRMGLGMGRIEGAAERVANLVVQRHADRTEHRAAEPGAVKRLRPHRLIPRRSDDRRDRSEQIVLPIR